jgi:hypothetical protein
MPAFYQVDELARCEGEPFDNFIIFNIARLNAMNDEGTFKVGEIKQGKDKLTIIVNECANCVNMEKGCLTCQGYHFSKPLPKEAFFRYIQN